MFAGGQPGKVTNTDGPISSQQSQAKHPNSGRTSGWGPELNCVANQEKGQI